MSTPAPSPTDSNLSLHEMLQIMDVARAIRDEQLTVEQQFQIEETRAKIRERLIASAEVTGDHVTPAEVDTAIQLYFDNLNAYRDPPWGINRLLAQMYVWRVRVVSALAAGVAIGLSVWLAFFNPAMPWSSASRSAQAVHEAEQWAQTQLDQLLGVTKKDAATTQAVDELSKEYLAIKATGNITAIQRSQLRMAELFNTLELQYELQIVTGEGRDSAVTQRWEKGGTSALAYYVIVEARSQEGRIVQQTVKDAETGETKTVTEWGEQVPKEVYDRLKTDKVTDGVLNETRFAEKVRGAMSERVLLPGVDGQPIQRGPRITRWN